MDGLKGNLSKKFNKEGVNRMRKLLGLVLVLGLVAGVMAPIFAASNDTGYVVVKCSGTMSVKVGDIDGIVNDTSDEITIEAGVATVVISSAIAVTNNGTGIITNWTLQVTGQEQSATVGDWAATDGVYPAWTYGATKDDWGDNKVALTAVFASAQAAEADFADGDILDGTGRYFETAALTYGPVTGGSQYATAIVSGNNYNMVSPTSVRNLYFRVGTPSAVTDQRYRRIAVRVTAAEGL
ncbi:MAG: hypothetical protein A2252_11015 [Elusimicrobia bacterium RIFOXYA2_FULL_39_19]|nr:MAG: hypothetical protein A2252_11015 [Elusimicrobia bacterium RIFOXYA2_FULL_39_19]